MDLAQLGWGEELCLGQTAQGLLQLLKQSQLHNQCPSHPLFVPGSGLFCSKHRGGRRFLPYPSGTGLQPLLSFARKASPARCVRCSARQASAPEQAPSAQVRHNKTEVPQAVRITAVGIAGRR